MLPRERCGGFVPEKLSSFYSQTTQYIIMKNYITVAALLAAGTAFANADVVAVFNCGGTGDGRGGWMDLTQPSWMPARLAASNAHFDNVTASGSNIKLSSEGSGLGGTGDNGSFTANPGSAGTATDIPDALEKLSQGVFKDTAYDTLWGGSVNLYGTGKTTFTLDGLTANTDYTVYLFCARANANNNGSATWTTETSGAVWSVTTAGGTASGSTVYANGSTEGLNASIVKVTFNTGDATKFAFDSGDNASFTLNGIVVDQGSTIPEPSAFGLLAGLGALALVASRRRK